MRNVAILRSLLYFVIAGLCEIGGGYLVWLWVREGKSGWLALGGTLLLTAYGFVATLQPANFERAYAAYGGIFIILSIIWGWKVDQMMPERMDWLGATIALVGVLVIMYAPRT
jgi:small multidrug resistance family-3 protein